MSEKISLEVNSEFLDSFFSLAEMKTPGIIEIEDLKKALNIIKNKINKSSSYEISQENYIAPANVSSGKAYGSEIFTGSTLNTDKIYRPRNVLIVDDLGIVTVQLQMLFKKLGYDVVISKELFDAIDKYKTKDFGYAVMDLFLPTEREGFILIDEIKKLSLLCKINTMIIVMSASNKKEHKEKCINKGANHYIEKIPGWQKKILEACFEN
jgi:CheY-like chemotaxis protein